MLELFLEPAKFFIDKGVEKFLQSHEQKNLSIAVLDGLRREMRFNATVVNEAGKLDPQEKSYAALIESLRTRAFDEAESSPVPLTLLITQALTKEGFISIGFSERDEARYQQYMQNDTRLLQLIERVYYRIHITQTFASCGKTNMDLGYVNYMLRLANYNIKLILEQTHENLRRK